MTAQRERELLLLDVLAAAPDFVTYLDLNAQVVFVRSGSPQLDGKEVIGRSWFEFFQPDQLATVEAKFRSVIETGEAATYEGPGTAADGGQAWYSRQLEPVRRDTALIGVAIVLRENTAPHWQNEASRKASAVRDSVIETVREPLVVLDEELKIVSASSSFVATFCQGFEQVTGVPLGQLGNQAWDSAELGELLTSVVQAHAEVRDYEVRYSEPGTAPRLLLLDARRLEGLESGHVLILVKLRDVTERDERVRLQERHRQLEAANDELDGFTDWAAHDLRLMLGLAQVLATTPASTLSDEETHALKLLVSHAQRMGQRMEELVKFSRIARSIPEDVPIEVDGMVREVVSACSRECPAREVSVAYGELPDAVGDPGLIRLVWENLIGNAFKFTAKTEAAKIQISGTATETEVIYSVADNGTGFDMKLATRLFGVFQRFHPQDDFPGVGAGLALVRRIVTRHGGRVWAQSTRELGATFWFALPRRPLTPSLSPEQKPRSWRGLS